MATATHTDGTPIATINGTNRGNALQTADELNAEAIVIGAGFSGLRMLFELRNRGISAKVLEAGAGVSGS
jgi:cyclohexanone monooxygenase